MPKQTAKKETAEDREARRERYKDAQACWRGFVKKFLVERRNFLFDKKGDGEIFTAKTMREVKKRYAPLAGVKNGDVFVKKARAQYAQAPEAAKLAFAHALFAYKLIARIDGIAAHKKFVNCLNLGDFSGGLYWHGVALTGKSYVECGVSIAYILEVFEHLAGKNQKSVPEVNKTIRAYCEGGYNNNLSNGIKWMANVFFWYAAPNEYEPIISQSDKERLVNCPAFVRLIENNPGYYAHLAKHEFKRNKLIYLIRKAYAKRVGRKWFSFYDSDVKRLWKG